jgi:hypothetical protein
MVLLLEKNLVFGFRIPVRIPIRDPQTNRNETGGINTSIQILIPYFLKMFLYRGSRFQV